MADNGQAMKLETIALRALDRLPQLKGSAYDEVSIRQLLTMTLQAS